MITSLVRLVGPRSLLLLVGSLLCVLVVYALSPNPDLGGLIWSVLSHSLPLMAVALGMAVVISAAEIDLSAPGIISCVSLLLALAASYGVTPALAWAASLLAGVLVGGIHALLVGRWQVPALVLTLGSSFFLLGLSTALAVFLQKLAVEGAISMSPRTLPEGYDLFEIINPWIIISIITLSMYFWRFHTLSGVRHLATGLNKEAAELAALPTKLIRGRAFVVAASSSAIAALFLVNYIRGGTGPRIGLGYELLAIAACVVGGVRISGGYLRPIEVILAAILIRSIDEAARAAPFIPSEMYLLAIGLLVTFVAILDGKKGH